MESSDQNSSTCWRLRLPVWPQEQLWLGPELWRAAPSAYPRIAPDMRKTAKPGTRSGICRLTGCEFHVCSLKISSCVLTNSAPSRLLYVLHFAVDESNLDVLIVIDFLGSDFGLFLWLSHGRHHLLYRLSLGNFNRVGRRGWRGFDGRRRSLRGRRGRRGRWGRRWLARRRGLRLTALRRCLPLVAALGVLGVLRRRHGDDLGDGLQGFVRCRRQRSERNRQSGLITNSLVARRRGICEKIQNNSGGPHVDLGYPEFLSAHEVPGCRRA